MSDGDDERPLQPPVEVDDLRRLRSAIRQTDRQLLELAAERIRIARAIGDWKAAAGLPVRNYRQEAEVLNAAEAHCERLGVDPRVGRDVMARLIREAVRVQELDRVAQAPRRHTGEEALIIGGSGRMGQWFAQFLDGQGYDVSTSDPAGPVDAYPHVDDPYADATRWPLILVTAPPSEVAGVLRRLKGATGLVVEISSLKSPFLAAAAEAVDAGMDLALLHPMWGPDTELLSDRNLVVCDLGREDLNARARGLFEGTAANVVTVPAADHDAIMAYTLGLPHALNLVFTDILAKGPYAYGDVAHFGGPTFQKQVRVAREVAGENRELYRQIQRLNAHTPDVYRAVTRALEDLAHAVEDKESFRALMDACESYYEAEVE